MCMCECLYESTNVCRNQTSDSLELELKVVVISVLGTKLRFSARAVYYEHEGVKFTL